MDKTKAKSKVKTQSQAIENNFDELEKSKLKESLIEGYKANYFEDLELNADFKDTITDGLDEF